MPSAEERFDQASDNTRVFLEGTVAGCSEASSSSEESLS